jgi:hypothetical protein
MALVSTISLAEAIARGHEFWELALSVWGNAVGAPLGGDFRFPVPQGGLTIPGLTGIAISPSSLVDQANVLYRLKSPVYYDGTTPSSHVFTDAVHTDALEVSAQRPWLGVLPGPIEEILAVPLYSALTPGARGAGVWANTLYTATYLPQAQGATVAATFGPALGADVWIDPVLRLLFYLRNPPPSVAPARAPFSWANAISAGDLGTGTERLVQVVPISGRKHVRVLCHHQVGGASAEVRVTGVVATTAVNMPEIQLAPGTLPKPTGVTTIAAGERAVFYLTDPQVTFLCLYAKGSVGSPGLAWEIYATD